jgi:N-hydroxyarylamine O-acetyltransferase
MGGPENAWTSRTHLLILVSVDDVRYVVDVGFGRMVPTAPLRLDDEDAQTTPHESFRLTQHAGQYMLQARINGVWRAMYNFDLQVQQAIDFEIGNWYVTTHADSPLISQLMVARAEPRLRRTLNNGSYGIHPLGGITQRRQITDVDELISLLQGEFGIRLPRDLDLESAIAQLIKPGGTHGNLVKVR